MNELPPLITSYKPQILQIKISYFRSWIEKRLTQMLDGLEDEILWGLVYNYLEDAQKRAKREGPASNPSGGLNAKEIQTALSGFLGAKQSLDFTVELFTLLQKAEQSGTGIPPEFNMRPEEAENEALGIIQSKRKELELSDRVRREIRRTQSRDYYRESDRHYHHRHRSPSRDRNSRHNYDSSAHQRHRDRYNDYYDDERYHRRHRRDDDSRDRRYPDEQDDYDRRHSREHKLDYEDDYNRRHSRDRRRDNEYYRDHRHERKQGDRQDIREEDEHHRHGNRYTSTKSPILSSSPESPSPCWETSLETAQLAAPRAPNVQESVSNELEQALKARALRALVEKK